MMINNQLINDLLAFPTDKFSILEYDGLVSAESLFDLDRPQSIDLLNGLLGFAAPAAAWLTENFSGMDQEVLKEEYIRSYTYCFVKSMALVYKIRAAIPDEIIFSFDDMMNNKESFQIPAYFQGNIPSFIPQITRLAHDAYNFGQECVPELDLIIVFETLLFGASALGREIGVRLAFED